MNKSAKTKAKRTAAKKPAKKAAAKARRRVPLKTKQRRKASASVARKRVEPIEALAPAVVAAQTPLGFSPFMWPTFPLAMMNMWWRTGERAMRRYR